MGGAAVSLEGHFAVVAVLAAVEIAQLAVVLAALERTKAAEVIQV